MAQIVKPMAKRVAEMEALNKQLNTLQEALDAKADFVAMMTDVDLSMLVDDETEVAEDGTQRDV